MDDITHLKIVYESSPDEVIAEQTINHWIEREVIEEYVRLLDTREETIKIHIFIENCTPKYRSYLEDNGFHIDWK